MRQLIATDGQLQESTTEALAAKVQDPKQGFWLDIERPDESDYALLQNTFNFHPLTLEDIRHQNQRPKLEEYADYFFIVLFTAEPEGNEVKTREHHLYLGSHYLVSVHMEPSLSLQELRERINQAPELTHRGAPFLFYLVVDQLVDSLFPVLDHLDDDTDKLEDSIMTKPDSAALVQIQRMKHDVVDLRKVLGAQRDVLRSLTTRSLGDRGEEMTIYFRDVYDHIVRQYETVDSLRDLLSSAMDVYLSTVSNRLNDVMRRLTVIATLFMPLSFITGFFGMNFGWLVAHITEGGAFTLALTLMFATVVVQFAYFRRHGWV